MIQLKIKMTIKTKYKVKSKKKKLKKFGEKKNLCCWMKFVGVAPSSSKYTRK
jgi:hypothetical protein